MCTFLALETFSTKVWILLVGYAHNRVILQHKSQQAAQTERQTKTTAAVSAGPAKSQRSPGLNLSTMSPMASRAHRCPVSRWQAGRAPGKWVKQGPYTVPSYQGC